MQKLTRNEPNNCIQIAAAIKSQQHNNKIFSKTLEKLANEVYY